MHPVVFSSAWFSDFQRPLLTLLNAPVIGGELRDALALRRCDVGGDPRRRIVRILPHAYIVRNPDGTFTMDVRTHAKYAMRLRSQFDPIWKAAHAWDRFVANPLVPALNLGFDTLTVYPDPDPESTTVDGQTGRSAVNETWATIRAGAGNDSIDSAAATDTPLIRTSTTTNQFASFTRSILLFDTSALTAAAIISAGVLSVWYGNKYNDSAIGADVDVYTSTPASNTALANADFAQVGTTSQTGAATPYASITTGAYTDFTFNATGRGNINKTGVSKFGQRNANYDVANVDPSSVNWTSDGRNGFNTVFAETTGSANDPKLVVTYTVPAAALTGTVTGSITEGDIVAGGKTIILTLTGDTFIA
jgi:hypothetical protein